MPASTQRELDILEAPAQHEIIETVAIPPTARRSIEHSQHEPLQPTAISVHSKIETTGPLGTVTETLVPQLTIENSQQSRPEIVTDESVAASPLASEVPMPTIATEPMALPVTLSEMPAELSFISDTEHALYVEPIRVSTAEIIIEDEQMMPGLNTASETQVEQLLRTELHKEPSEQREDFITAFTVITEFITAPHDEDNNFPTPAVQLLEALTASPNQSDHEQRIVVTSEIITNILGVVHGHQVTKERASSEQLEIMESHVAELVAELCNALHIDLDETEQQDIVELLLSPSFVESLILGLTSTDQPEHPQNWISHEHIEQGTHESKLTIGNVARHASHGIQQGFHQILGNLALLHFQRA